ncbi:PCC domain-containing protein [Nocardioides bruguierae]|uniref:PCC domain-containing protein n=1 Tax=Nocardioides bruguierae TaxID=2945102 RepID=UPI002021EC2C|nr:DUF296 domain-containing protein [Nocardioides bruguierae]MCL8026865.1 hypothetical protein [Nocardioides bruguierae]
MSVTATRDRLVPADGAPLLRHPGPVAAERVVVVPARLRPHTEVLPAGVPLLEALAGLLARTGASAASGELVGGELASFSYFVPDVGAPGGPVANFSAPRAGSAPARLVHGGLTLGHRDGEVFSHSHALFVGADGERRAGHLIPDSVVLGEGVTARVWTSVDVDLRVEHDPETTMSLFVPQRVRAAGTHDERDVDALLCRVRPNVDLVGVVEHLVAEAGWAAAAVRGQIGSLVGARLGGEGGTIAVDGPATEVMHVGGTVVREDDGVRARLTADLVDRHGAVHSGALLPGLNPVAMTYELVLTRLDAAAAGGGASA